MNPQFTPKVIQEKLTKNQITKQEAGELFIQFLEKSSDEKIRIEKGQRQSQAEQHFLEHDGSPSH